MKRAVPFYNVKRSYDYNYAHGPFGLFRKSPKALPTVGTYELFGIPLDMPFGIPAGPLLTGKFVEGAWRWGFSLATYKTVRGNSYPTHPFPNVIKVQVKGGKVHPGDTLVGSVRMDNIRIETEGITNSFGVPSKTSSVWQTDAKKALKHMKKGSAMIISFMGTKKEDMDRREYIENFAKTCRLAKATGAPILEVNFSCPNFGKEGLICNDVETSRDILEALKKAKGNIPLLVKIGYFAKSQLAGMDKLLDAIHQYADGVAAINTIAAKVVDTKGRQMLPGNPVRLSSGICGATIRWGGLEMAKHIMYRKKKKGWKDFVVIGVGGVTRPEDYFTYMRLGVNAVQSATGAMWRPTLALEIRKALAKTS